MKKTGKLIFLLLLIFTFSCNKIVEKKSVDENNNHLDLRKAKVKIKSVGILLYDGYSTLDAMGPYQVFSEMMGVHVFFVGTHSGLIPDATGMKVQVYSTISNVKYLDILLIPGGFKETYEQTKNQKLLTWIKEIDKTSKYTTSVCTGSWILGAAGLLKGKEATSHWYGKKILANDYGAIIKNKRYVQSGKYWTSAGITAGMDMSLAIINNINGEKATKAAMLDLEYDPQPPFSGGSVEKSDKKLVDSLRANYDAFLSNVINPSKALNELKIVNKIDPVCGMPIAGSVGDTIKYKGKIYGFCSKICKENFKKNPTEYLEK